MKSQERRAFENLLEYIGEELEFESGFYNEAYLDRRITARLRRTDAEGYRSYQRLLERDDGEREQLLDSLSINVTGFFRNPEAWERLAPVLAELTDRHRTVRIWSAPCADGREPYSLAMLAMDHDDVAHQRVEILGTDINPDILSVAREGVYETSQTTDIEEELEPLSNYRRYIERHDDTFSVRDTVKKLVEFEQHDLIRGDPKADFDLVLCRNLLIYIDADYKTPIFRTIRGSLRERGYLMIGMTETLPADCRDDFEPVEKQHRIYRRV
jgi:chemotaxis protein methyltransferase CheR